MAKLIPSESDFWLGSPPATCDVCSVPIGDTFIDGKTAYGPWANMRPWANMCPGCHRDNGSQLGTGKGQRYQLQPSGKWAKMVPAKAPTGKKRPSLKTLERWSMDGVAKATDGCTVEPDGVCSHGAKSWLLVEGLI